MSPPHTYVTDRLSLPNSKLILFGRYRKSCIRSRIIPLPQDFIEYLNEDGIILGDDEGEEDDDWEPTSTLTISRPPEAQDSDSEDEESPPRLPPNRRFPALHQRIKNEIQALGGAVAPKLNWSSPKDAANMSPHQNTVKCTSPNDIYLLFKSSSFIAHDLSSAFSGCAAGSAPTVPLEQAQLGFNPVLVLRSFFDIRPSLEFRCFVKHRNLVAITPRDLRYYGFLDRLRPAIIARAKELFDETLRFKFPDGSFAFDVYIPESGQSGSAGGGLARARLIDINPWAPRTDPLLFGWGELLDLHVPHPILGVVREGQFEFDDAAHEGDEDDGSDESSSSDEESLEYEPELRLVEEENAAEFNLAAPEYSAHKMPREVVDAAASGAGGLREFGAQWQAMMERRI